jgi:tetratricopeptide (TPR) repeat protein
MSRHEEMRQLPSALMSHGAVYLYKAGYEETTEQLKHSHLNRAQQIFADAYREAESAQIDNLKQFLYMSWIRHAQARASLEQGDLTKAAERAKAAIMLFTDVRHRYGVAHCRLLLGRISLRLNQPREVVSELLSALETFRNCGDGRIVADVSMDLAQAFLMLGNRTEARRLQRSAVSGYLQLRDQEMAHAAAAALLGNLFSRNWRRPEETHNMLRATLS